MIGRPALDEGLPEMAKQCRYLKDNFALYLKEALNQLKANGRAACPYAAAAFKPDLEQPAAAVWGQTALPWVATCIDDSVLKVATFACPQDSAMFKPNPEYRGRTSLSTETVPFLERRLVTGRGRRPRQPFSAMRNGLNAAGQARALAPTISSMDPE